MVTVKGEGGGCVSGVLAARRTLAGRIAKEAVMRCAVLCHWLGSPRLRFPSLPVSRVALLSPPCEWKAARGTNAEYKWDSWEETHFLLLLLAGSPVFVYMRWNSAGYYITILFVFNGAEELWKSLNATLLNVNKIMWTELTAASRRALFLA